MTSLNPVNVSCARHFLIECFDPGGVLKWREEIWNLTVDEGLDEILDKFWKGASYTASHFIGLTDGTPTFAAGDTMGSHAGWAEVTAYDETARPSFNPGTVSGQSVDNSGSKATYTINASVTVGGAFVTTNSTKGGTSGILIGEGPFNSGDRSAQAGDTINVTVTATAASS